MILRKTFRPLVLVSVVAGLLLLAAVQAQAQHHGGGGGFGGMGGMGGPNEGRGYQNHVAPPMRSGPQLAPPGRWWEDNKTVKKLGLSSDQKQHMDDIFNANKGALFNAYGNLQREELHLSAMSPQDLQDEKKVFAAIDRIAQARTDLEKESAHIQLQLRQQLSPAQLDALDSEIASLH